MDSLSYFYTSNTNRLHKVTDAATDNASYSDIKQGQADNNYQYDAIGNLVSDASESITNITWNVYGKITSITKSGAVIRYVYDASGNRIMKQTTTDTTIYVRDATGNVMSVYAKPASGTLAQTEVHIYGSSRLGMATKHIAPDTTVVLSGGFVSGIKSIFIRGEKIFELSNHLGNVLVTISDRRMQSSAGGITVDYYTADVVTTSDYYPGGMLMPGRSYSAGNYRFGFNGKDNDNEVKGTGNQQDYGLRIYDPRLGRFLSVDPLTASYPWYSPYQFAGNNPIKFIDLDGGEPKDPGTYKGQGAIAPQIVDGNTCEGTDNYRWTWNNSQWNYTTFNVTNGELTSIFDKGNADALKQIETSVNLDGSTFGINSKKSLAHFLSQAGHEVGGFTKGFDIEEGLNYSVDGLITTFNKYFYKGTSLATSLLSM